MNEYEKLKEWEERIADKVAMLATLSADVRSSQWEFQQKTREVYNTYGPILFPNLTMRRIQSIRKEGTFTVFSNRLIIMEKEAPLVTEIILTNYHNLYTLHSGEFVYNGTVYKTYGDDWTLLVKRAMSLNMIQERDWERIMQCNTIKGGAYELTLEADGNNPCKCSTKDQATSIGRDHELAFRPTIMASHNAKSCRGGWFFPLARVTRCAYRNLIDSPRHCHRNIGFRPILKEGKQ